MLMWVWLLGLQWCGFWMLPVVYVITLLSCLNLVLQARTGYWACVNIDATQVVPFGQGRQLPVSTLFVSLGLLICVCSQLIYQVWYLYGVTAKFLSQVATLMRNQQRRMSLWLKMQFSCWVIIVFQWWDEVWAVVLRHTVLCQNWNMSFHSAKCYCWKRNSVLVARIVTELGTKSWLTAVLL